jgi:hypothetical protein
VEDAHAVGAGGEEGVEDTRAPGGEGAAVVLEELDELAEGLDAAPLVAASEAGLEAVAGSRVGRGGGGALGEDVLGSQEVAARGGQVGGGERLAGLEGLADGTREAGR